MRISDWSSDVCSSDLAGWAWQDFVDAPLGEEFERYRLRVLAGGAVLRTVAIESCTFSYDAAMASADTAAAGGEPLLMEIVQIGSRGIRQPTIRAIQSDQKSITTAKRVLVLVVPGGS